MEENQKTVFILGAGASCSYGFPTGAELRNMICDNSGSVARSYKNNLVKAHISVPVFLDDDHVKRFTDTFFYSNTPSIDLFLSRNESFNDLGKFLITHYILHSESTRLFKYIDHKIADNWYPYIFHRFIGREKSPEFSSFTAKNFSIITFNYDRSLEYYFQIFLLNSFADYFFDAGLNGDMFREHYKQIFSITHVYGDVGADNLFDKDHIPYQGCMRTNIKSFEFVNRMCKNIGTIYSNNSPHKDSIINQITSADTIFFLGFSYARENLNFLGIPGILSTNQRIYGTCYNMVQREIEDIHSLFSNGMKRVDNFPSPHLVFENTDILTFLRNHL